MSWATLIRLYHKTKRTCNGQNRQNGLKREKNQRKTIDASPVQSATSFEHIKKGLMDMEWIHRRLTVYKMDINGCNANLVRYDKDFKFTAGPKHTHTCCTQLEGRHRKKIVQASWFIPFLLLNWLLIFYILGTSKVISRQTSICDSAHSWWLYSAAPLENQAIDAMTQSSTHSHYSDTELTSPCPDTELTSPCPILLILSQAGNCKHQFYKSLVWLDWEPNSQTSACGALILPICHSPWLNHSVTRFKTTQCTAWIEPR